MAKTKKCKFEYLRAWIMDYAGGSVTLECIPSRSGMSMPVYVRGERIFSIGGCGFDRIGTALGDFLQALFQPELREAIEPDHNRPYASPGCFGGHTYGSTVCPDGSIRLEGASGINQMIEIAKAIGLDASYESSKFGTLIHVAKLDK